MTLTGSNPVAFNLAKHFDLPLGTRIFDFQITRAMTTKLTLTIDDTVIDSAKKYARQKGKSLSAIVENYLKSISAKDEGAPQLSPKVKSLMGVISLPEDFDYKKELGESLQKKYSK